MNNNNVILKKQITLQLEKGKNARHIIFNIELRETKPARDWETLQEIAAPVELSICGAYRLGGCSCQNLRTIESYADRVKEQDKNIYNFIVNVWGRYHLNTLKAGTKKQAQTLAKASAALLWADNYADACQYLKDKNILEDRGYKYGSGWLVEQIPADIIAKIKSL